MLDQHPDVMLCCTASTSVDAEGQPTGDIRHEFCHLLEDSGATRYSRTLGLYPMHVLFGVCRRAELARTRLWGTAAASDRVIVSEIALNGKIYEIPEPLFIRRWHPKVSWVLGTSDREYSFWYDPKNRDRKLSVPKFERGLSYAKAINHSTLSRGEAARAYAYWLRYALWTQGVCSVVRNLPKVGAKAIARAKR